MEKYLINFEDGQNYLADNYTDADVEAMENGLLSIVRVSDCKVMMVKGLWIDLPKWISLSPKVTSNEESK